MMWNKREFMRDTLPPPTVGAINEIVLSKCPSIVLHFKVLSTVYSRESNIPPLIFGGLSKFQIACAREPNSGVTVTSGF